MKKEIHRYQLEEMWNRLSKNDNFYITKNDNVCGAAHWHDCFEIEFVIKGSCKEVINEKAFPVSVGDIALISPTDLHELRDIDDLTIYNLMFETEIIDNDILNIVLTSDKEFFSCHLGEEDFNYVLSILEWANREFHKREFGYERFVKDAINQLLTLILRNLNDVASKNNELSIRNAAFYIRTHFGENPSLEDVAKKVALDPAYFSVKFHAAMGTTFKKYLNETKLKCASRKLMTTEEKISDICYDSGFESISHFHREFKKKYGCTPSEYREKNLMCESEKLK